MNEKELDVMKKILQCKHVTAISSEKALELIDEVRRLNEKVKWLEFGNETLVGFKEAALKEQEDLELYKDLYTNVNTQNMVYKVALEKHISILRSVLQVIKNQIDYDEGIALGGVIVQLEKVLEGDTNES